MGKKAVFDITDANQETSAEPKATASGIPVYCAHDAIVPTKDLKPNPQNPNQHPATQIRKLATVIRKNGWRTPITVSTLSGMVVKGHGRLLAAQLEDLETVPVDYQDYESEAAENADLWADNYIAELAETDDRLAASLLASIQLAGIDLEVAGSSVEEYNAILAALEAETDKENAKDGNEMSEPQGEPVTKKGDVWLLGKHRIMCGDSSNKDDRAVLLNCPHKVSKEDADDKDSTGYIMEKSPSHTDAIVCRWIQRTGRTDVKCIRNGKALSRNEIAELIDRTGKGDEYE